MTGYRPPLRDYRFLIEELVGLDHYPDLSADLVGAVLEEAAKLSADILAPLNTVGDRVGAQWQDGDVVTPPGFREAHRMMVEGGWVGLRCNPDYGGQGMPHLVAQALDEMMSSANMAFALSVALNMGAVEAIELAGSDALRQTYLPRMVSGEWAGTMCLTEPQAGSDLAAIRTRAVRDGEQYRIFGQKIFITWGEHDLTENIVHLVLARIDGAPEGVRGISMFVVPKYLPDAHGAPVVRNDLRCTGIEHKLGIHGSPTASLSFGDGEGAVGYLVGEENRGLEYMFVMMNLSRLNAGLQGGALGERAYQAALHYARDRVQGSRIGVKGGERVAILAHPDVRRLLMTIKAQLEACRTLTFSTAALIDRAHRDPDPAERAAALQLAELLTPVVKGWCTETGQELCSAALQVHGGMGFIEETGVAQYYRDIRISAIYEGTTAIQANDLLGRKIVRDGGAAMERLIATMRADHRGLADSDHPACTAFAGEFGPAIDRLTGAAADMIALARQNMEQAAAVAVPFLTLVGQTCGGWMLGRSALIAAEKADAEDFYAAKLASAAFYATHILPRTLAEAAVVRAGASSVLAVQDAWL